MGKPGTTLDDPLSSEQKPDLRGSLNEISEYLAAQGAYDLFDYLLKEMLLKQPADPLQFMIDCLSTEYRSGPLKVIVIGPSGLSRQNWCRRIAEYFGLVHISAGQILRDSGVKVDNPVCADEAKTAELVMKEIQECTEQMQGWVLDGFPRTRLQTTYLKERSIVPTHVLLLKASQEEILERCRQISDGEIEGDYQDAKLLVEKLNFHSCHTQSALEPYWAHDKIKVIDALAGDELVWEQLTKTICSQPRSGGPKLPPRIVILGPRGVGAKEHASRLAFRLGAVFVDGEQLFNYLQIQKPQKREKDKQEFQKKMTVHIPNLETLATADSMGPVGVRLRQPDCRRQGWVLFGFPTSENQASLLQQDECLSPLRVILLQASEDACVQRLRFRLTDPVTGKVWTQRPKSDRIRRRLVRDKRDEAEAVCAQHREYMANAAMFREAFGQNGQCLDLDSEGDPAAVHSEIIEFVERPLPVPVNQALS